MKLSPIRGLVSHQAQRSMLVPAASTATLSTIKIPVNEIQTVLR